MSSALIFIFNYDIHQNIISCEQMLSEIYRCTVFQVEVCDSDSIFEQVNFFSNRNSCSPIDFDSCHVSNNQ